MTTRKEKGSKGCSIEGEEKQQKERKRSWPETVGRENEEEKCSHEIGQRWIKGVL